MNDDLARDLLEALGELRADLRRLKREGLVARLSPAERHEIAIEVFEMVDARLAPADAAKLDDAPRRRLRK